MKQVYRDFTACVHQQKPVHTPFAIWPTGPFVCSIADVKQKDYYLDPETKFRVLMCAVDRFPEAIFFPGIFPEFGAVLEPSIFGSEILWHENDAPHALRLLYSVEDIDRLTVPRDLENAGLMPEWRREADYFWKHLPERYIEDYGFLDGLGYFLGPLETAATLMNYSEFLLQLCLEPEKIHKLLDIVTDGILASLRIQERVNGKLKRLVMADHMAHQVSTDMFLEFCAPYYKRIYDAFSYAEFKLYHNEGNVGHIAHLLSGIGINLMHYGADTQLLQQKTAGKVALMGNLHPLHVMLEGTPEAVYTAAVRCICEGEAGGGHILSTAGGLAFGTPPENVDAAIKAVAEYGAAR